MNITKLKKYISLALIAFTTTTLSALATSAETIKIGAVAPKTGPLAGGAAVTHWPNVQLWVEQVNARGGLKLKDGMHRIELVEYDDRTDPGETIRSVQRLATNDKVDIILPPYGTGMALAAAPIFNRLGYPMVNVAAITDKTDELAKRFDNVYFTLGKTTMIAQGAAQLMADLKAQGKIGERLALVNVADAFGIELAKAAKPIFEQAGFEIVYDASYPPAIQDISPVVSSVKAANPNVFVAFSYPPDSFALTEQVQLQGLEVDAFYTAVGTNFAAFHARFGEAIEGQYGVGGVDPDSQAFKDYAAAHQAITGKAPDYWASAVTYAAFQVLEQAIEGVGEIDRKAINDYIKTHSFDTVMGTWVFDNQQIQNYWTVGQWQDGKFYGIAATGGLTAAAQPK